MAVLASRRTQFSSILELVSSQGPVLPRHTDFESMEDVHELARFAASSSDSVSDSISSRNSASSANHSFYSPLLRSASFQSNAEFRSGPSLPPIPNYLPRRKDKRSGRSKLGHSVDYHRPADVANQRALPSPEHPMRAKSFNGNGNALRHSLKKPKPAPLPAVDESTSSSAPQTAPLPLSNGSRSSFNSTPATPRSPTFATNTSRGADSHARRKSLDLGPSMMQAGIRRLKRSPSMWTMHTGDKPITISAEARDRHFEKLRAEPQLTEQQKLIVLKRARKIAQVFGSEAPTELIQGLDYPRRSTTEHRDSLSTIISTDMSPSVGSTRRRSNSASSASVGEITRRPASIKTSFDQAESSSRRPSDIVVTESAEISIPSPPLSPTSTTSATFRERRRRAAKLTQFFGVNYQDISKSITQTFVVPSTPKEAITSIDAPVVEVDVKVAGRRFWGLADGELKNAEVADVIDKLRGLKAS
ncbi:hypothetical protein D9615_005261 [Tricholomella constricta]|uniref:Uncharacterized protein n=1 Tax=Tricholomella constricta TaxID=117010 RepID=A0A8H5M1M3_9AGAR|nr:hypothetical protein D9615_005261 [Tricholomella constricta]